MGIQTARFYENEISYIEKLKEVTVDPLTIFVAPGTAPVVSSTLGAGTTFITNVSVDLTSNLPDTKIVYTTDGSTPFLSSNIYTAPLLVTQTTVVKARAIKEGINQYSAMITITLTKQAG